MAYKHGVYGEQKAFAGTMPLAAIGTIPAYIGTAPIQQLNTLGASGFNYWFRRFPKRRRRLAIRTIGRTSPSAKRCMRISWRAISRLGRLFSST